jgi:PleD family two-component response regulator
VTAKKTPEKTNTAAKETPKASSAPVTPAAKAAKAVTAEATQASSKTASPKSPRTTIDDLALDIDEKDELLEQEKRDLAKALAQDEQEVEDEPLETAFVPTDTSERFILVVDEEGQRRNETVTIVQQILPNAVVEVADDPEEAAEVMQDCDFDTFVVNFLMPGFSASPFVKAVANHPDHPLLIGFAADKISDALDQRKGLKIIPLKRLFDLDVNAAAEPPKEKLGGLLED